MTMRTHTQKNTCARALAQTICTRSLWLTDKQFERTRVHILKSARTHLYPGRLLFSPFPSSQTSKRRIPARILQANSNITILSAQQCHFKNVPSMTTCGICWRMGGFEPRDMNTQLQSSANKICTFTPTPVRINNMQKSTMTLFYRCSPVFLFLFLGGSLVLVDNDFTKGSIYSPLNIPNSYCDIKLFIFFYSLKEHIFEIQRWIWRIFPLEKKAWNIKSQKHIFSWPPAFVVLTFWFVIEKGFHFYILTLSKG